MSRHRFFINRQQIRKDEAFLSGYQARQIHQVLRLRAGDRITVLDNEGWEYEIELQSARPDHVSGRVIKSWQVESEPRLHLTLYQSMLKKDRFEWIVQKGTELGVSSFVPMVTERSVVRHNRLKRNKMVRWQRIIREAAEQSGRGFLPTLSQPVDFATAVEEIQPGALAMIPWTGEGEATIATIVRARYAQDASPPGQIALFLGPEGGFSDDEIERARSADILPITLGPRILRAETAAIVAATLTLQAAGDLQRSP